jgi:MFS family permease
VYQVDAVSLRAASASRAPGAVRSPIVRTVWLLGCVSCLTDISSEMVASVLPVYLLVQLGLSPLQFGVLDGLYAGVTAVSALVSGVWADRSSRHKRLAAVGYALSAFCKLGLLTVGSIPARLAAVISLDRVGKGIRTAPRDALISLSTQDRDLASAFGVHRALDTAGAVLGPLTAYLVLTFMPARFDAVFVISFVLGLLGLLTLVLLVDDARGPVGPKRTPARMGWTVLHDPRFRLMTLTAMALSFVVVSDAFLYLLLRRGARLQTLPLLYVGTACSYLILAVPLGRLADRIGRGRMYVAGHLVMTSVYVTALATEVGPIGLTICLVLHGAYYAATDGVLAALTSTVVPAELRASGLATLATASSLARFAGSVAFGALWTLAGPTAVLASALIGTGAGIVWTAMKLPALDPGAPAGRATA